MSETVSGIRSDDVSIDFDYHDSVHADDLYEVYDEYRERCPVAHSTAHGGYWFVTRYEDIREVQRNPEVFSSRHAQVPPPPGQQGRFIPLEIDPPQHAEWRHLMTPLFSPTRMAALEPQIHEIVTELLDAIDGQERCDFLEAFARPLPTRVFMALMGWPLEDADKFHRWIQTALGHTATPDADPEEQGAVQAEAAGQVYAYFGQMLQERMENPDLYDDVTMILINGQIEGRPVTQEEILNMLFLLMIAGLDTVMGQLAHSMIALAEEPGKRRELVQDTEVIPSAVEEMLRLEAAVSPARVATRDVELGGMQIKEGDFVVLPLAAGNHDPEKFECPADIDLRRDPNPHLTFGGGIHRCLGAHLARNELRIAFEQWHARFPDYRLDPEDPPVRYLAPVRGVERLTLILGESI